jgi:hypothetical protein
MALMIWRGLARPTCSGLVGFQTSEHALGFDDSLSQRLVGPRHGPHVGLNLMGLRQQATQDCENLFNGALRAARCVHV